MPRTCGDGTPCLVDSPDCYAAGAGLCAQKGRYARIIRSETMRRGSPGPAPAPYVPEPPRPAPPAMLPRGVVQVWPAAFVGGAERAMISVLRATSPAIPWGGVALLAGPEHHAPEILDELRALGPVAVGVDRARALLASAEVAVSWAVPDVASLLPADGPRPKVVAVSHSPGDSAWAVETLGRTVGVDRWVAVSEAALAPIPEAQRGRAVVIPNAVDHSRMHVDVDRDRMKAEWGLPADARILGGLNRLSSEKRTERLVDAVAALPPEWFGVVVGEGNERATLEAYAAEVAPGRVIFPGARSDVGNVLMAFDWLLVASAYESFCLSMAEAFWMGVPVVSTPVGIAAEHPEAAWLVGPDPSGAEIAATVLGARDPEGRRREEGISLSASLWSPDRLGRAWADLLRPMLAPASLAPDRLVASCAHAGCKTGCRHRVCNRDHREVHHTDCVACATGE